MKYSNIILFSDLDGTLLDSQSKVSKENLKAIEHFVAEGGRFGVATGRAMKNALGFLKGVPLNYYSIFLNGSMLYDMKQGKSIAMNVLDKDSIFPFVRDCVRKYPGVGIQIYLEDDAHFVSPKDLTPDRVIEMHPQYGFVDVEEVHSGEWLKAFFYGDPKQLKLVEKDSLYLLENEIVDGIYTHVNYYELLPKGSNKGSMIKKIHELKGDGDIVFAVGDYYNDAEMIIEADVGIYTQNAPEDLKEQADYICVNCNEDAIANVIYAFMAKK